MQQIERAAKAKADAVKFQLFTNRELYGHDGEVAHPYALPREWIPQLKKCANENDIEFMCSAFSCEGFDFVDRFVCRHKIASAEATDKRMYKHVLKLGKQTFISTGGLLEEEIRNLFCDPSEQLVCLMHCAPSYPATADEYDLGWFRHVFLRGSPGQPGVHPLGLSDHTLTHEIAQRAKADGYFTVFEKHVDFTTDGAYTPDSAVSIDAKQFDEYIAILKRDGYAKLELTKNEKLFREKHQRKEFPYGWFRPKP